MARGTRSKGLQKARRKTPSKTKSQSQIALEKEYKRLRKNLQQKVRYYRQKGMLLYDDIIPAIPKKITSSSVKRLQKIDVRKRALKGEHIDLETGEIIGAKIKIPNTPIQPYYPTISVIDTIRQRLNGLELQTKGYDPNFENMKNTLINIPSIITVINPIKILYLFSIISDLQLNLNHIYTKIIFQRCFFIK